MSGDKNRAAITSEDAGKDLDVTGGQVRRLYREGKLAGYRLESGEVMIYLDSLDEYRKQRSIKYGKAPGWVSPDPPENKASRRKTFRDGTPKTKAERIAAGLAYRAYQRDFKRRKREEERLKKERNKGAAAKGS